MATTTEIISENETCVFCGSSNATKTVEFPQTFTAYQLLQAGNKACPQCTEMFTNPKYRRNCWMLQNGKLTVIEKPLEFLLTISATKTPFILYLTKSKRKHGWIRAVQNPVLSAHRFILIVDEDKIYFDDRVYVELYAFCKNLFARRIPKTVMLGGMPKPSDLRKNGLTWKEAFKLRELQHNQLWRVIVGFKRRD